MPSRAIISISILLFSFSSLTIQILIERIAYNFFGQGTISGTVTLISIMAGLFSGPIAARKFRPRHLIAQATPIFILIICSTMFFLAGKEAFYHVTRFIQTFIPTGSNVINQGMLTLKIVSCLVILLPIGLLQGYAFSLFIEIVKITDFQESRIPSAFTYSLFNTGAALGVASTIFLFIPLFGIKHTGLGSCVTLFTSLLFCFSAFKGTRHAIYAIVKHPVEPSAITPLFLPAFLSGFTFIQIQLVFIKITELSFGPTWITFGTVTFSVMLGYTTGSLLWKKRGNNRVALSSSLLLSFILLISLRIFFPDLNIYVAKTVGSSSSTQLLVLLFIFFSISFLSIPLFTASGVIFCHLSEPAPIQTPVRGTIPSMGGYVFSVNSLGALAGGLSSIPLFTYFPPESMVSLCAALLIILSLSLPGFLSISFPKRGRSKIIALMAVALSFIALVSLRPWDPFMVNYGPYLSKRFDRKVYRREKNLYSREGTFSGPGGSALLLKGKKGEFIVKLNGKPASNTLMDSPTQLGLSFLPYLYAEDITSVNDAFIVGYGSGQTAYLFRLLFHQATLDIAEISREVLEVSRGIPYFDALQHLGNTRITIDDGKFLLASGGRKYDVIISQPSNPWVVSSATLFSKEFYEIVRSRLSGEKLFVQWLQSYGISKEVLIRAISTFAKSFPSFDVWSFTPGDLILVGRGNGRKPPALDILQRRVKSIENNISFMNLPLPGGSAFPYSGFISHLESLSDSSYLTDDRPIIAYDTLFHLKKHSVPNIENYLTEKSVHYLPFHLEMADLSESTLMNLGESWIKRGISRYAGKVFSQLSKSKSLGIKKRAMNNMGVLYMSRGNIKGAIEEFLKAISLPGDSQAARYNLYSALKNIDAAKATEHLKKARELGSQP